MRIQRDCHLEGFFRCTTTKDEATRRLGRCTLHPWQAAVLARIMQLTQRPERMLADFSCWSPPHTVTFLQPVRCGESWYWPSGHVSHVDLSGLTNVPAAHSVQPSSVP